MNLLQVPSSVIGLMGARSRQQNPMLGLFGAGQSQADNGGQWGYIGGQDIVPDRQLSPEEIDGLFLAAQERQAPDNGGQWGYIGGRDITPDRQLSPEEIDGLFLAADPSQMQNAQPVAPVASQAQPQVQQQQAASGPAPRRRVSALGVLGRALAPNISGALDSERARLQAEADAPALMARAQENERIARALGPQALLAYRANPSAFGESVGYQYRPTTTGAGGVSTVFGTGQQVEAPRVMEFGNNLVQAGPISGTRTLATRGPSYSEQASLARVEQDAAQAEARLDLDYRRLDQADSQFNQSYEQREREYLRQADARAAANGGRGKITEGQAKDGFNASRLEDAGAIIAGLEGQGFDFGRSGITGGQFREGFRSYDAAAEEWTDAMLRLTTGAAATKQEMASNRRSYFPQPGDSEAVRRQKAARRAQLQQDAIARAGPGYFGGSADSTGNTAPALPPGFVLER